MKLICFGFFSQQVVKVERLKADLNALMALCEKTDNDIRSCLNTLQVWPRLLDLVFLQFLPVVLSTCKKHALFQSCVSNEK